jgi:hypothetical protein
MGERKGDGKEVERWRDGDGDMESGEMEKRRVEKRRDEEMESGEMKKWRAERWRDGEVGGEWNLGRENSASIESPLLDVSHVKALGFIR